MDDLDTFTQNKCTELDCDDFDLMRDLIQPMFEAKQRDLRQWELRLNEYLRTIISERES